MMEKMNLVKFESTRIAGKLLLGLFLLNFAVLAFASTPADIATALSSLCSTVKSFLGVALLLMIILAAVTYAVGQIMGAETRARASVWATAMFTGALFAAIIYLVIPWAIDQITDVTLAC